MTILRFIFYILKGDIRLAFQLSDISNKYYVWFLHLYYGRFYFRSKYDKAVVIHFDDKNLGRYAFTLVNAFALAERDVYLYPDMKFYASARGLYILRIFDFIHVGYLFKKKQLLKYKEVVGVKFQSKQKFNFQRSKEILIDYNAFNGNENTYLVPFGFHPLIYLRCSLKTGRGVQQFVQKIYKESREIPILFGGTIQHSSYNNINRCFTELLNRNKFFSVLQENFKQQINIEGLNDGAIWLYDFMNKGIKPNKWMEVLGNANFFLSPPGFEMPVCHNLFESMTMGCIPIIEYGHYLRPKLEDGINAIVFNGENEFVAAINRALGMESMEIEKMRKNVKEYSSNYFDANIFINAYLDGVDDLGRLTLIAGTHSLYGYNYIMSSE